MRAVSQEDVETLRGLFDRWGRGDFTTREAFDPEVEFARVGTVVVGGPGRWRGADEMWRVVVDWLRDWEEVRFEAEEFLDLGDRVLVLVRQIGRGTRSGLPLETEQADLFTLRDGKIVQWESYWNRAEAMRATGLED